MIKEGDRRRAIEGVTAWAIEGVTALPLQWQRREPLTPESVEPMSIAPDLATASLRPVSRPPAAEPLGCQDTCCAIYQNCGRHE